MRSNSVTMQTKGFAVTVFLCLLAATTVFAADSPVSPNGQAAAEVPMVAMPPRPMSFRGKSASEAAAWQKEVRRHLAATLLGGSMPRRVPLEPKVEPVSEHEKFVLVRVTYRSRADRTNYALLALPRGVRKAPAVLALHGHESAWGQADKKAFKEGHIDDFCAYFANRGFVVIFPAVLDHNLKTPGWTLIGHWIWDAIRALDYLETRPDVDVRRIGCVGLSTGGLLTMYTGALDERIQAAVSAGCFTTWHYGLASIKVPPNCDCGQRSIRALRENLELCDIYALFAPRPMMLQLGRQDVAKFPGADASKINPKAQRFVMDPGEFNGALAEIRKVYAAFGKPRELKMHFHPGGHQADNPAAFEWITSHLKGTEPSVSGQDSDRLDHAQGEMAGEVTPTSAILQSRLTKGRHLVGGDVPGSPGIACFEVSIAEDFSDSIHTTWVEAKADNDFIVKARITDLKLDTRYYYRLIYGPNRMQVQRGRACSFRTVCGKAVAKQVSFVVVTSLAYWSFHHSPRAYRGEDRHLGYPALKTILDMKPDFFVGTGDNVYYDRPLKTRAGTMSGMRRHWHQQFVQPRFVDLFAQVPTYWEKDDHDYRFNDSDPFNPYSAHCSENLTAQQPSHELGVRVFREQVPIVDPHDKKAVTYRTHRISRDLQIWLVEGRDYRSRNTMPDGPLKTIWGDKQRQWLKRTLLASDATFKLLISPTPMIGPDGAKKRDNHTNFGGFRHEAKQFFAWLRNNDFLNKNFYIVCGDRHWQYHSISPSGFEEFSCGALDDASAVRHPPASGDRRSTDPNAEIKQPYFDVFGGFLKVTVQPATPDRPPTAEFSFYDKKGTVLYQHTKRACE